MGRVINIKKLAIVLYLIIYSGICKAQKLDTIYIIDYFVKMGPVWGSNPKYFINEGLTIKFTNYDTVFFKAGVNDTRLKLSKYPKGKGIILGSKDLKVKALRIIKRSSDSMKVVIHSKKRMDNRFANVDTFFIFKDHQIDPPYFFANFIRNIFRFPQSTLLYMEVTNKDFAYKNNYLQPKIRAAIMNSVVYEYYYPEGKLIRVKE